MKKDEGSVVVVRAWLAKAENDLLNATHTLKLGYHSPTDTVCFHAQQCAEKYLKALLVLRGIEFPKTHDLEALFARLRNGTKPELLPADLARLSRYATTTHYPGVDEITLSEARKAVASSRRIRRAIRALLPRIARATKENT